MEKKADNRRLLVLADKSITRLSDFKLRSEKSGLELWCAFLQWDRERIKNLLSVMLGVLMHFSSTRIFKFKFFEISLDTMLNPNTLIQYYNLSGQEHKITVILRGITICEPK